MGIHIWRRQGRTRQLVSLLVAIMSLFLACADVNEEKVRLGMSQEKVIQLLGEPDRKAVLVGKVLRDLGKVRDEDLTRLRLVYVFDTLSLQVWFEGGRVTGVTRHGVSIR